MSDRFLTRMGVSATCVALVLLVGTPLAGQAPDGETKRTPWGDPDLQGVYTFSTPTPMERPEALGTQETYTDAELAQLDEEAASRNADRARQSEGRPSGGYDRTWTTGGRGSRTNRTSLIIDPPNGRIPPLTPEAQRLEAERRAEEESRQVSIIREGEAALDLVYNSWNDLSGYIRCVGRPVPRFGGAYNHGIQILQTPGYVVLHYESMHDARIIPLDGSPTLDSSIRQWNGSSRGHWEGDTLVVHLTNLTDKQLFRGTLLPMGDMEFVERFTRIDENTVRYEVTVNDPTTWTEPWTFVLPWRSDDQYQLPEHIYEFACHEGNYRMMEGTLRGSRTLLEQTQ